MVGPELFATALWRHARAPAVGRDHAAYTFLEHGEREATRWSGAELVGKANALAHRLLALGLRDQPVLLVQQGPDFVLAMCACLLAQVIAVPLPDVGAARHAARIAGIMRVARPRAVLCTTLQADEAREGLLAELPWIATDEPLEAALPPLPPPSPEAVAFLQFTSGSTREPRGVVVRQDNLAANLAMIRKAFRFDDHQHDCVVTWLPPFHDMGLVGGLLTPLAVGVPCVAMTPLSFMQKPERWLAAMSRYRGTVSGGPDFAYALCATRAQSRRPEGLDLSPWRLAFCGAEKVRRRTLERFEQAFAPAGFRGASLFPCYGLAEATLFVTGDWLRPGGTGPEVDCGPGQAGQELRIVDPETGAALPEGSPGELLVAGPHVSPGYWEDPAATAESFGAQASTDDSRRYLRTGDIGVLRGGRLTISGRIKHIVIIRSVKHHAEDVEASVGRCHPALENGGTAAFAADAARGEELIVLQEVGARRLEPAMLEEIRAMIAAVLAEEHGVKAGEIVLVPRWSLPRTSSGKLMRAQCRAAHAAGSLRVLVAPAAVVTA